MKNNSLCKQPRPAPSHPYFGSLRELMINLLRSAPFGLDQKHAEVCARIVLRAIHQHQR